MRESKSSAGKRMEELQSRIEEGQMRNRRNKNGILLSIAQSKDD